MAKYIVELHFSDGEIVDDPDMKFDTEEDAYEYGLYLHSCMNTGKEILHMSNPGDYPLDDDADDDYEIVVKKA